jgi:hypothetical protein
MGSQTARNDESESEAMVRMLLPLMAVGPVHLVLRPESEGGRTFILDRAAILDWMAADDPSDVVSLKQAANLGHMDTEAFLSELGLAMGRHIRCAVAASGGRATLSGTPPKAKRRKRRRR